MLLYHAHLFEGRVVGEETWEEGIIDNAEISFIFWEMVALP